MNFLTLILRPSSSDDDDDSEFNVDNNNSDLEPVDSDEDDPEFAEINSWNRTDLMGDKEDRRRLFAMSEFEREKELAERREKVWACGLLCPYGRKSNDNLAFSWMRMKKGSP